VLDIIFREHDGFGGESATLPLEENRHN